MSGDPGGAPLLLGCGILRREVEAIVREEAWPVELRFLDPLLHCDFEALAEALGRGLGETGGRPVLVFYGACHPRMDAMVRAGGAVRIDRQNCIEMLLGRERFLAELEAGSYFLLEEWALGWEGMIRSSFGGKTEVAREIFKSSHSRLLALETPCSGDYVGLAESVARQIDLPLLRLATDLSELRTALASALGLALAGSA